MVKNEVAFWTIPEHFTLLRSEPCLPLLKLAPFWVREGNFALFSSSDHLDNFLIIANFLLFQGTKDDCLLSDDPVEFFPPLVKPRRKYRLRQSGIKNQHLWLLQEVLTHCENW